MQEQHQDQDSSSSNDTTAAAIVGSSEESSSNNTTTEADAILASKLNGLSIEERDSGLHDLHGVSDTAEEESLEMLQAKIQEMNRILDTNDDDDDVEYDNDVYVYVADVDDATTTLEKKKEYAYKKAKMINQGYVDQMKVTCLRAESYDSIAAASRLVRYFHRKLQLFGLDCLAREIIQDDFTDIEKENMKQGLVVLLPYRDRAGRAIIWVDGLVNGNIESRKSVMRIIFYMCCVPLRDVETQREGVVLIYYGVDQKEFFNNNGQGRGYEFWLNWNALPWRNVAFHMCMSSSNVELHSQGLTKFVRNFQSSSACRARLHAGTHNECIYTLLTFGIPQDSIPVMGDGIRDFTSHHSMLDTIRRREKYYYYSNNSISEKPSSSSATTTAAAIRRHISNAVELVGEPTSTLPSPEEQQQQQQQKIQARTFNSDVVDLPEPFSFSPLDQQYIVHDQPQDKKDLVVENLTRMTLPPSDVLRSTTRTYGGDDNPDDNTDYTDHNDNNEEEEELVVLVPSAKDILLGRGRLPKSHPGNMKFRNILQEHRDIYDGSQKRDKKSVNMSILEKLKSNGCRFLLFDKSKGGYIVVKDEIAKERISHGFRNLRMSEERKNKVTTKNQTAKTKKSGTADGGNNNSGCDDDDISHGRNKKKKSIS